MQRYSIIDIKYKNFYCFSLICPDYVKISCYSNYKIIYGSKKQSRTFPDYTNAIIDYYVQTFEYLEQKARFSVR